MNTGLKVKDIADYLETIAPLEFQESYDNSGLLVGSPGQIVSSALATIDVTEEVVDEAISRGCNLIIAHHPIIFSGIKKLTGENYVERTLLKAVKNDIAIYTAHTNLDSVMGGVNSKICGKLGLTGCKPLQPLEGQLQKLVTYIPADYAEKVRTAVFEAGAGHIGNYDSCSYNIEGLGSFRGNENTNPFVGKKGAIHFEKEVRFETIFPKHLAGKIISALILAHPYEEVAYDIYPLSNKYQQAGIGMVGELSNPVDEEVFLTNLKRIFACGVISHTKLLGSEISKVAVCGGSGSFLLKNAITANADIFITADFKYHQYFDAENKIIIANIGHYESEQFTKELFYELLIKKFPKFAVRLSEVKTNPVYYF
ncbi:GTP cyclohydrolase 1 type 2 homolog YbgI [hydrothermal vent metagenome]|uniref:GTP cyclohydrolase 1 type 2 homolog YbgI n=1 Tax=hydrothermal vent metagenome TaxID=652676 RepID=A0A3B0TL47_9ZZZZ